MYAVGRLQLSVVMFTSATAFADPAGVGFTNDSVGVVGREVYVVADPKGGFPFKKVKLLVWLGL